MNPLPDYLQSLEYLTQPFPYGAVEEAIARREESIPHLLEALSWVNENAEKFAEKGSDESKYMLHDFAMYLLAQFRETRAYPLLVTMARSPHSAYTLGDGMTCGLSNILASVCGGDTALIEALIEDPAANEYARSAGVSAFGVLLHEGVRSEEEVSAYLGKLFKTLERKPGYVWNALVEVCTDFRMAEHLKEIRRAYRADLADESINMLEEIEVDINRSLEGASLRDLDSYQFVTDAVEEMQWWGCFEEGYDEDAEEEDDFEDLGDEDWDEDGKPLDPAALERFKQMLDDMEKIQALGGLGEGASALRESEGGMESVAPIVRTTPKIGRNDPCPCNSGKKYKKCCGR